MTLTWSKNCVKIDETTQDANTNAHPLSKIRDPTGATFEITDTELYVPTVILSTEDDNKPVE